MRKRTRRERLIGCPGLLQGHLQFRWILQQFDDALEQPPGATAVEAAMIETQCQLGLSDGNELLRLFIPYRCFFARAKSEQQRLVRQRNRRAPIQAESAKV